MIYSIQFLRYMAASLVVIYHAVIFLTPHMTAYGEEARYLATVGAAGVHIFFVISGFVMVWTLAQQFGLAQPWTFFKRRVARIYPLYWILALLNVPFLFLLNRSTPETTAEWIGAFLLWPSQASELIFVGWTLAFEMFFYTILAVFLALQWSRAATLWGLSLTFIILVGTGQLLGVTAANPTLAVVTNVLLLEFIAGAWIAQVLLNAPALPRWLGWAAVLLGLAGFALSIVIGYNTLPSVLIWGIPSILLVFGLPVLEQQGVGRRFFPRFAAAGDASYALYLVHPVLIPPAARYLLPDSMMFGLGTLSVLLLVTYAALFWLSLWINRQIEKPLLRVTRHFISARQVKTG